MSIEPPYSFDLHFVCRLKFGLINPLLIQEQYKVAMSIHSIDTKSQVKESDKQKLNRLIQCVQELQEKSAHTYDRAQLMVC